MACIRSLTTRAKFIGGRHHPSAVSCFLHYDDDYLKHNPILPPSLHGSFLHQKRAFGNSSALFGLVRDRRSCLGFSNWTLRIGASPCRNFSDHVTVASAFLPVAFFRNSIDAVHSLTGFNWWISIVLTTFIMRVTTLPIFINELKARPNYALLATNRINQLLDKVKKHPLIPHQVMDAFDGWRINVLPNEFSYPPVKIRWLLVQAFIHACFFVAVLKIAPKYPCYSFWSIYGVYGDFFSLLPIIFCTHLIVQTFLYRALDYIVDGLKALKKAKGADGWTKLAFGCTLLMFGMPFLMNLPEGVCCYLATSKLFTLTFIRVVKYHGVDKALGILPKTNGINTNI